MSTTRRRAELKGDFIRIRGTWSEAWQSVLDLDPDFFASYLHFSSVPWTRDHLEPKVKEFIYIAVDAATTHLYAPGIRQHIKAALGRGASAAEIMEVIEITSTLGIHACNIGVPLYLQVLEEQGLRTGPAPLDERRERLKEEFTKHRGYWHTFWDGFLEIDPELFEAYLELSSVPWKTGVLEPKVKELIYTAFDVSATHLYVPGLKLHLENAIRLGATTGEIIEVFEIASAIGIHAATVATPILVEELRNAGSPVGAA